MGSVSVLLKDCAVRRAARLAGRRVVRPLSLLARASPRVLVALAVAFASLCWPCVALRRAVCSALRVVLRYDCVALLGGALSAVS